MADRPSPFSRGPARPLDPPSTRPVLAPPFRPPSAPSGVTPDTGAIRRLSFHGSGGSLFGIHTVNLFLTLVTLGVYSFWGKVRVRRYLLAQSSLDGDRFAYHGSGKELLLGFLKALLVFVVPLGLLGLARDRLGLGLALKTLLSVMAYGLVVLFVAVVRVGARRYRLSRTSWRGIRFSFRGRVADYLKLYVVGSILTVLTLGFYYPVFATKQQAFMVSHSYVGSQRFAFDGRGRDLLAPFVVAVLLTLPTLGLCWYWFIAQQHRYFWNHTSVATARFHSVVTGARRLGLGLGDIALLLLTLGLGWSWIVVRDVRFAFRYLTLEGPLDPATIEQDARPASAIGEGLAGFFDTGFDFG